MNDNKIDATLKIRKMFPKNSTFVPFSITKSQKPFGGHIKETVIYTRSKTDEIHEPLKNYNRKPSWKPILVMFIEARVPNLKRAEVIRIIMDLFPFRDVIYISHAGAYLLSDIPHVVEDMKNRGLFRQQSLFDDIKALEFIICREKGKKCLIAQKSADSGISFKSLREYISSCQACACVTFQDLNKEEPVIYLDTTTEIPLPLHQRVFPFDQKQYACPSFLGISKEILAMQKAEIVTSGSSYAAAKRDVIAGEHVSSNDVASSVSDNRGPNGNVATGLNSCDNVPRHAPYGEYSGQRTYSREVRKPPRYERYSTEPSRAESYSEWPHAKPTPKECASSGLFFTGDGDLIRCFQCGIGLKNFSTEDNPMDEHIKHSESCHFLETLYGVEELTRKREQLKTTNPDNIRRRQYAEFQKNLGKASGNRSDINPEYRTLKSRTLMFENANFRCVKRPEQLAEAGFFYTGVADHVRCFSCNGGLRNWEEHDDPWTEHCKWFPECKYAREIKGEAFIEQIQQKDSSSATMMNAPASPSTASFRLNLDQELEAIKITCVEEMGFNAEVFDKAVHQLKLDGYDHPEIDDIISRSALIQT